jgi:hypothetical protein
MTHLPRVQITSNEDGTNRLLIDGHDLSMIAERVELFIDGSKPASVNVWVPASAAIDIPANLVIFVDYPEWTPAPTGGRVLIDA